MGYVTISKDVADMALTPTFPEHLARLRADLRMGLPVYLKSGGDCAVAIAAETLTQERLNDLRALGTPSLAVTDHRATTLKARAYDGDLARIVIPDGAALDWIATTADPSADLRSPMKGPYVSVREGEALVERAALALCKSAHLLPAVVCVRMSHCDQDALEASQILNKITEPQPLIEISAARVPLAVSNAGRVRVFRPSDGGEEHYAVEIGLPDRQAPVLTRLHSACFTGDILGSLKCDCGPQLNGALQQMAENGSGVLLYLNQEGRGIGLANKMRAYSLQDQGFDTVEANHRLGFEDDERDFRIGAEILRVLGIGQVNLLTNNPGKVQMLERCGLTVANRLPLEVGRTKHNTDYLDTKASKSGHLL